MTRKGVDLLLGASFVALVAFGSCATTTAVTPDVEVQEPEPEPFAGTEPESEPEPPTRVSPWTPPEEAILAGVDGGGQLLAQGQTAQPAQRALEHLAALTLEPGSPEWFRAGPIAGRAHLRLGEFEQAVAALEPRLADKQAWRHFPIDLVGYELALARIGWAKSGVLDVAAADAQLQTAIKELGRLRKLTPDRINAAIRVAQGEAMAALRGTDPKSTKRLAKEADDALGRLVVSFPYHPRVGQWLLDQALARTRSGRVVDGAAALRRVHIDRAGELESDRAWAELELLGAQQPKLAPDPLSSRDRLDAGMHARTHRRLDRSRELLESVWTDPEQPTHMHREAGHSLAWTYHKLLDNRACAEVLAELYADVASIETRDDLTRCYERAGMADEAIALWVGVFEKSKSSYGATALWTAIEQAFLGGRYAKADELLTIFEAKYRSHAQDRRWLHAWLPLRLGDHEKARLAFTEMIDKRQTNGRERAARYFLGKLELAHGDRTIHLQGVHRLQTLVSESNAELVARGVSAGFVIYYGVLARERLREAGEDPGPAPELAPLDWEQRSIGHAEQLALLRRGAGEYGKSFTSLIRAEQLFAIGWHDEASREVRVASDEFINARSTWEGSEMPGGRSESLRAGLSWALEWSSPKASASRDARKLMRDEVQRAALRDLFLQLTWATPEPYEFGKLTASEFPYRSRWHLRAYREPIERHAWEREVDPHHVWSLMYTESRFRRHVVSYVGARGALQIMPWTGRQLVERLGEVGEGQRFDPDTLFEIETNSRLAVYYVDELLAKFHGQPVFAYASYNCGPSNVARWLTGKSQAPTGIGMDEFVEEIPFSETANYARRVMEVNATYALMYRGEVPRWGNTVDPVVEDNISF